VGSWCGGSEGIPRPDKRRGFSPKSPHPFQVKEHQSVKQWVLTGLPGPLWGGREKKKKKKKKRGGGGKNAESNRKTKVRTKRLARVRVVGHWVSGRVGGQGPEQKALLKQVKSSMYLR